MPSLPRRAAISLRVFGALAILLSPSIVFGGAFLLYLGGACMTEVLNRISDLGGLDFEISETDCDTFAKDASISVLVSQSGRTKKSLLFKYDPSGVAPLPE